MADHMRTELIGDALTMAHTHGRIEPHAVFHSDRASHYTSEEYASCEDVRRAPLGGKYRGVLGQLGGRIVVLDVQ